MTFHHGSSTTRNTSDTVTVGGVDTAIIGLVGIAPIFDVDAEYQTVNNIVDISDPTAAAKYFGKTYPNYTIPQSLEDIFKQKTDGKGGARIFVINVFNPSIHKSNVSSTKTFVKGKITLAELGIANLTVTKGSTAAVLDTDYTFVDNVIEVKTGGSLTATDEVTVAYDYADPSKITNADIIGGVDQDGIKTGLELLKDVKSKYGVKPKIIIAPAFTSINAIKTALEPLVNKLKAYAYIDAPMNTSLNTAIEGRGEAGTINFNTSNERIKLLHHHYKVYNKVTNSYECRYASPFAAGLRANLDRTKGVHWSSSNQPIYGIEGFDVPVSFELNDVDCDANKLNSYGITTTINDRGTYKEWGNRNASFPASNGLMTFECCVRQIDYIEESIENFSLNVIDGPISDVIIDRIITKVTDFFSIEKKKGALIDAEIFYNPAKNPASQLANGMLVMSYKSCPPPPLENLVYENDVVIEYLNKIGGQE
ncbi:MAG: phage tail sheath subtilisin-like domain-containing protein [Candidatus Gastranaerophilales bacterium]|nr:phage tail sheath subtilisin-like domain-containing protein [Candidatus Gastranaerophilales bacterium]